MPSFTFPFDAARTHPSVGHIIDLRVPDDLWAASMLPAGVFERWRVTAGAQVGAGDVLAEVLIEDARHELIAPRAGQLLRILAPNAVIEPGALIGRLALSGA